MRQLLLNAGVPPEIVDLVEELRDLTRAHVESLDMHPANVAEAMIIAGIVLLRFNAPTPEDFVDAMRAISGINVRAWPDLPDPPPEEKPS